MRGREWKTRHLSAYLQIDGPKQSQGTVAQSRFPVWLLHLLPPRECSNWRLDRSRGGYWTQGLLWDAGVLTSRWNPHSCCLWFWVRSTEQKLMKDDASVFTSEVPWYCPSSWVMMRIASLTITCKPLSTEKLITELFFLKDTIFSPSEVFII